MPRTRDDIGKAQREEQTDHARALEKRDKPVFASKPGESSGPSKEKKTMQVIKDIFVTSIRNAHAMETQARGIDR